MNKAIIILTMIFFITSPFQGNTQCIIEVDNNGFEYSVSIDLSIGNITYTQEGSTCNVEIDVNYNIEIDVVSQPGWWNESLYVLQGNLDCQGGSTASFFDLPNSGGSGTVTSATFSFANEDCSNVDFDCPITIDVQGPNLSETVDCGSYIKTVLPVILANFQFEEIDDDEVQIKWTTQAETNFSHFELQKSIDLKNWELEATIPSGENINGNSYSHNMAKKSQYSRLKMIDIDGRYEYSDILYIENNTENILKVFPNPATDVIYFSGKNIEEVLITNAMGQSSKYLISDAQSLDISDLSAGFYLLQTKTLNGSTDTQKIVKR